MNKVENQHGDVILHKIDEIPSDAKRIDVSPGFILERGEGVHTHIFPDVSGIEVSEKDRNIYVHVTKKTVIDHEEHGKQTILPGKYVKDIERVWDYETEEARKVQD